MKYIYILALFILIIICCFYLKNLEAFAMPTTVLAQIESDDSYDWVEAVKKEPIPNNMSLSTLKARVDNIDRPIVPTAESGGSNYEPKETHFEKEDAKCKNIKFCENLSEATNCGYCLQDDIEGQHAFHYGNKEGPFEKRDGAKQSLCRKGVNRDGISEWVSPSDLNGTTQNELETELKNVRKTYKWKLDPRRLSKENDILKKLGNLGIQDTGYSGCMKMRERYICSKVNDCSPMNFEMFGIKAKDICGFCADDGKSYARKDLPDRSKSFTQNKYITEPKCENIEIFGDGVDCKSHNNNKNACLGKRSLRDASVRACAYNYNAKKVVVPVVIPKPALIKYPDVGKSKLFDKCESKWGLIRPGQCSWFEQAYPCLKTKMGGPHEEKCLQSLWRQMGFQTNYRVLLGDNEGKQMVDSWHKLDVDSVLASMENIYQKVFSRDFKLAKKWAKLCYDLEPNVCNRAGFVTEKYPHYYWKENTPQCLSKLYKYAGGKEDGLINPKNTQKMAEGGMIWGSWEGFKNKEGFKDRAEQDRAWRQWPNKWRVNETEQERIGSNLDSIWHNAYYAKHFSHRDYLKRLDKIKAKGNMPNHIAKRVRRTNVHDHPHDMYSNVKWVDKYIASKAMTGKHPGYPVNMEKPCWPDFARRMLINPGVKLLDLNTLSFQNAGDFHTLSYSSGSRQWEENLKRSGNRFFGDGYKRTIKKEHYEQETFPFWKWIEVANSYWKKRWHVFYRNVLDYSGSYALSYKELNRPNNENIAKQIASAHGMRLGGKGYSFGGNYSRKGLYFYTTGTYAGRAYFGRYGSDSQAKSNGYRLDRGAATGCIKFTRHSRFFNALPVTKKMNEALYQHKLLEITENGLPVRYLMSSTYVRDGFPYYNFLLKMGKN